MIYIDVDSGLSYIAWSLYLIWSDDLFASELWKSTNTDVNTAESRYDNQMN